MSRDNKPVSGGSSDLAAGWSKFAGSSHMPCPGGSVISLQVSAQETELGVRQYRGESK